jgi:hypothetical protein
MPFGHSANQEFCNILWNQKFNYSIYKSLAYKCIKTFNSKFNRINNFRNIGVHVR